jgi:O-antigen/teichoic acid export membrane protein
LFSFAYGPKMKLAIQLRGLLLFLTSFLEIAVPFVRTLIISHLLVPYEFGFASALAVTSATFSQITDIAISSFVVSSPRSVYSEALAGAHALAIVRGFLVCGLVLLACKPVACSFGVCSAWSSFAWLAPVMIISSFEHFEIRVAASRDYQYWPALVATALSNGVGLAALFLISYKFENHSGFIVYLLVQSSIYVLASHLLASSLYRADYRSQFLREAFWFGLPLILNGIGLAIMSQGDRWIVGGFLGLPFLGLYAVVTLAGYVPLIGLLRIIGPIVFGGLHHANVESGEFDTRLKLYSRAVPVIAAVYALGLMALYDFVVPAVFGPRYVISEAAVVILATITFVRIVRNDPQTCLLFHAQKTHQLAVVGQAPFVGLLVTTGLAIVHPTLEFVLIGTLVGEIAGLCSISYVSRRLLNSAIYDHAISVLAMGSIVVAAGVLLLSMPDSEGFGTRIAVVVGVLTLVVAFAGVSLPGLYWKAYGARGEQVRAAT